MNKKYVIMMVFWISNIFGNDQSKHDVDTIELSYCVDFFGKDFFESCPLQSLLQGMLTGIHPYDILLYEKEQDHQYLLIKSKSSYTYLLGNPDEDQLINILKQLTIFDYLVLICDESLQTYFMHNGFGLQSCIEFEHDPFFRCDPFLLPPQGFQLFPIDGVLFKQSPWYEDFAAIQGGAQQFLDTCFGYALVDEFGNSVSQAYGEFIGNGLCEMSVITLPAHQGKGYIAYSAYAVIQECYRRGLTPVWNCVSQNIVSIKTACKLGFHIKKHFALLKRL